MQLRTLIAAMAPLKTEGSGAAEITGLAYEARRVAPGDVYFALQRGAANGHAEIDLALARGAAAVVCRQHRALRQRAPVIQVADPRLALADAAEVFYGRPGDRLRVTGVTGGLGAWKTAWLLKTILRLNGLETGLISSFRHEIGDRRLPAGAPPESSDVQRWLAELARTDGAACVLELPEISAGAMRGIPLDLLVFAGGGASQGKLLEYLSQSSSRRPGCAVIDMDRQEGWENGCAALFATQVTFGRSSAAQVSAQDVSCTMESAEGALYFGNDCIRFEAPVTGRENMRHLLAACAAAWALGAAPRDIGAVLHRIPPLPGSLEPVPCHWGFSVFVDEARDERSLEAVLRSLSELASGRILLAFGCGAETDAARRFAMGRVAGKYAQQVILTSDNPGRESVERICGALARGLESAGCVNYHFQPDRADAIGELIGLAREGDVLLISGKGHRAYQELADTVAPFDDRIVAAERLETLAGPRPMADRQMLMTA